MPRLLLTHRTALPLLLVLYCLLAVATLVIWQSQDRYTVTGDEPHYLFIADSIGTERSFEISAVYRRELRERVIYPAGLAPPGAELTPRIAHAVQGPHGLYSVHNVGLPTLLALPMKLAGVPAAKLTMILLSGLLVVVAWQVSALFSDSVRGRFWAVAVLALGLPFVPAATQVYPDVLAGTVALSGIYWLLTLGRSRSLPLFLLWALAIALLPWLQIKLFAPSAILTGALVVGFAGRRKFGHAALFLLLATLAWAALALYNNYAFGKWSGPYEDGALEFSPTSLMVLAGLCIDQNQGFLLQNPVLFAGLFSLGLLWRHGRVVALVWLLVFASLIVPNALHPHWYGGQSLVGRFAWSAAAVFWIPTLLGLLTVHGRQRRFFYAIIGVGLGLQGALWLNYVFGGVSLYHTSQRTWLDTYGVIYPSLAYWLPGLYDVSWGYRHAPNWAWVITVLGMMLLGWAWSCQHVGRRGIAVAGGVLVALLVGGRLLANSPAAPMEFPAWVLPGQTGMVEGRMRVAQAVRDEPGYLSFGPYIALRDGRYRLRLVYESMSRRDQPVGSWDVFTTRAGPIVEGVVMGTDGGVTELEAVFEPQNSYSSVEFRFFWNGQADVRLHRIALERVGRD